MLTGVRHYLADKRYHLGRYLAPLPPQDAMLATSYSQEGEDRILYRMFEQRMQSGFYVDVGAHHPKRFSNTYLFYLHGWRGINVDPRPGMKSDFESLRPRDVNLELGVSQTPGTLTYYEFNDPALNTFSPEMAARRHNKNGYHITREARIPTAPLREILKEHLPAGQNIDFLTVDVEGLDMEVLHSNDWTTYRPSYVLAEDVRVQELAQVLHGDITSFLASVGYVPVAKTVYTLFYKCQTPSHH